jgi:ABC-type Na+ efflux pump permease subunit
MYRHVWLKEISGELRTWKSTVWLVMTSIVLSFVCYLLLTDRELSLLDHTELLWLLSKVILGMAALVVVVDASMILNAEFENKTAESLFLSPLSLADIVAGKLLASLTLWLAVFAVAVPYMWATSSGTHLTVAFTGYVALLGTLGIGGLVMLTLAMSLLTRSSKNTLTMALVIMAALGIPALFPPTLKSSGLAQVLSRMDPIDNIFAALDNVLVDAHLSLAANWQYLLPLLIFCGVTFAAMAVAMRAFGRKGSVGNA